MSIATDVIEAIRGLILRQVARVESEHKRFMREGLGFAETEAGQAAFIFALCCNVFGSNPGLGAEQERIAQCDLHSEFAGALAKVGVGKVTGTGAQSCIELRLNDYFKDYKSAVPAIRAMTPAKKSALRAEAAKLLTLPPELWRSVIQFRSRYVGIGVRG